VGQRRCAGDHDFAVSRLGAGIARMQCTSCGAVMIDLDAAEDGHGTVTEPGLFRPARPTIFTVLAEEQRAEATPKPEAAGPRYVFMSDRPS